MKNENLLNFISTQLHVHVVHEILLTFDYLHSNNRKEGGLSFGYPHIRILFQKHFMKHWKFSLFELQLVKSTKIRIDSIGAMRGLESRPPAGVEKAVIICSVCTLATVVFCIVYRVYPYLPG